ncbi:hypothetical protein BH11PLA2_BH11PLA2_10830 [soil metagenome]
MSAKQRDPVREQFWRDAITDWQSSGLSVRAYCVRHQLTETAFRYWQRELRLRDAKPASRPAGPAFVPVTVIPTVSLTVEVRCPSGHVVGLTIADAGMLRHIFAALAPVVPC